VPALIRIKHNAIVAELNEAKLRKLKNNDPFVPMEVYHAVDLEI